MAEEFRGHPAVERERNDARRAVQDDRDRLAEIACELKRRASAQYLKGAAKDAIRGKATEMKDRTVEKTIEIKDRASGSPLALGLLAGAATFAVAALVKKRRTLKVRDVDWLDEGVYGVEYETMPRATVMNQELDYEVGNEGINLDAAAVGYDEAGWDEDTVETKGPGLKERLGDKAADIKSAASEKASSIKHAASDKAAHLKESAGRKLDAARTRATEVKNAASIRVKHVTEEQPLWMSLGAVALGAAIGMMVPLSDRERELAAPVRAKARERLHINEVADQLQSKIHELRDKLDGAIGNVNKLAHDKIEVVSKMAEEKLAVKQEPSFTTPNTGSTGLDAMGTSVNGGFAQDMQGSTGGFGGPTTAHASPEGTSFSRTPTPPVVTSGEGEGTEATGEAGYIANKDDWNKRS